jgi:hypothetical protein
MERRLDKQKEQWLLERLGHDETGHWTSQGCLMKWKPPFDARPLLEEWYVMIDAANETLKELSSSHE